MIFSFDYAMSNTYTETMTETNIAVATHGITKIYGGIRRVDDVSMRVMKGEIYGLIGRNGAGKTTLIRMILGIASPSSGSLELCGATTPEGLAEMRRRTGALIEQPAFYPRLSAAGNIKAYALAVGLGGIDPAPLLSLVGLGDVGKKQVRNFSLGMKQRLAIAMALAGDPELLFLDEPVNGLDPQGIVEIRELILKLNHEHGITVLISSHYLDELSKLATHFGFIDRGKLVKEISAAELEVACRKCTEITVSDTKILSRVLDKMGLDYSIKSDTHAEIYGNINVTDLTLKLFGEHCSVQSVNERNENLETFYINLVGGGKDE